METQSLPLRHMWPHGLMPVAGPGPVLHRPHRGRTAELLGLAAGLSVFLGVATWRWRAPPSTPMPATAPHGTPPAAAVTAQMDHDGTPHAPAAEIPADPPPAPESAPPPLRPLPRPAPAAIPGDFEVPSFPAPEQSIHQEAAATAIAVAARRAAPCLAPGDPRTTMAVSVVFSPSGQATYAVLRGGPFLGTETGSCIAAALRTARVGPFEGPPVSVHVTAKIR